ncbi:peptidase T [Vibrio ouci]|uniref:Peptidase T n=1 Tax=Vibrio ouci TaxID=2499078 RepID=A0A4Y8WBU2_9VIBR|nr:peptidase T [Vibrio ouci]TFH90116.1 peptidase T [Vibrio ouci]
MDIVERFLSYTKINTTTDREKGAAGIMPSSSGQMVLAKQLEQELLSFGLEDVQVNEKAIVTATLPANVDVHTPTVAFFAHLDTSAEQKADTNAKIATHSSDSICLNEELGIHLTEKAFPELAQYRGQEILVTDGTSLLGADDKAAIASIMDMLQYFTANPDVPHGPVKVAFLPDEEQGLRGAKAFDVESFGADFGYTLDCCGIGEFVCENWNAGNAVVTFTGQSAHPMSAKGKLKNSLLMAHKFIAMLPAGEAPEYTENREGYYWVKELSGNSAKTILKLDIRDFCLEGYNKRMAFLGRLAQQMNDLYGGVEIELSDRYENVANSLQGSNRYPIDIAQQAYQDCDIEMRQIPMRGGYDGAVLSQKGLPCPNLFTGAHNFHSIYEYLPVNSLRAASEVVQKIVLITHNKFSQ